MQLRDLSDKQRDELALLVAERSVVCEQSFHYSSYDIGQ